MTTETITLPITSTNPDDASVNSNIPNSVSQGVLDKLREDILTHFRELRLPALNGQIPEEELSKDIIRASHKHQRNENFQREYKALGKSIKKLLRYFANGNEVNPAAIDPELIPVKSSNWTGRLFRLACLLWSVPVSQGYGRRMRFLVMDRSNNKLIGIFALGDPVFNLRCRDEMIGWKVDERRSRLVNIMDAYVVGAVPPYNQLLGGKLVAALMCSKEVNDYFTQRYKDSTGIISHEKKDPRLVLITVTSALGRSSIYNRLRLSQNEKELLNFKKIGETRGFGHFQISNELFERMRSLLSTEKHAYAHGHQYGDGPNWKLRVTRVGLKRLGLDEELVHHGIKREVYACALARNYEEFLHGETEQPDFNLSTVTEISRAAINRWILPRSIRQTSWVEFSNLQLLDLFQEMLE